MAVNPCGRAGIGRGVVCEGKGFRIGVIMTGTRPVGVDVGPQPPPLHSSGFTCPNVTFVTLMPSNTIHQPSFLIQDDLLRSIGRGNNSVANFGGLRKPSSSSRFQSWQTLIPVLTLPSKSHIVTLQGILTKQEGTGSCLGKIAWRDMLAIYQAETA